MRANFFLRNACQFLPKKGCLRNSNGEGGSQNAKFFKRKNNYK